MTTLREFQSEFMEYLQSPRLPIMPAATHAALSVYRNTIIKGWTDVLAANYSTVRKLVGDEWFAAAAGEFACSAPPDTPTLAEYGLKFPAFLEQFPPAFDLPYLSEVARIDQLWIESYFAADAAVLNASILKQLTGEQLMATQLKLHPATRMIECHHSAVSIWLHTREQSSLELITDGSDECGLIARLSNTVSVNKLSCLELQFVKSIDNGLTLGEAAMKALSEDATFPLASLLPQWINQGVFGAD